MQTLRYLENVATLSLDDDACVGCGMCTMVCPHRVFALEERKARIIDLDGCMECGACAANCPTNALSVTPGVGCAAYIIQVWIKGREKAACGGGCC
jgi:NAD-dependent dihydropyrimidine dehydrogenase PreA subunit